MYPGRLPTHHTHQTDPPWGALPPPMRGRGRDATGASGERARARGGRGRGRGREHDLERRATGRAIHAHLDAHHPRWRVAHLAAFFLFSGPRLREVLPRLQVWGSGLGFTVTPRVPSVPLPPLQKDSLACILCEAPSSERPWRARRVCVGSEVPPLPPCALGAQRVRGSACPPSEGLEEGLAWHRG